MLRCCFFDSLRQQQAEALATGFQKLILGVSI